MDAVSSERPFYLRAGRDHVFCVAHGSPVGTGVVLSPPFGWEDVASYRARRLLAMRLATGGRLVLRFDPPGAGDSSGMPTDPGRLDAWCSALAAAESWLRDAGCSRVACLGIGLGGLVALRALGDAASFDELALWGTPRNGRLAVRELQAFSRLQSDRAPDPPGALPGDVIEAGGHVMSSETAEAVRAIDPSAIRAPSLRRALVLARPGVSSDARLADALAELGLPVTRADGGAYAAMTEHPQTSELPEGAAAALSAWLAAGLQPTGSPAPAPPRPREWAGERVREALVAIDAGDGALQGVLSSPAAAPGTGVGLVLFNAGAIRRTGPSRLWVEVARAWAAEGSEVLRLDLDEIGDSGAPGHVLPTPALYAPERRVQAEAAVAWMLGLPAVDRVVVAGLCVGGSLAFHTATRVGGVSAGVLLNAPTLLWDPALWETRDHARLRDILRPASLRAAVAVPAALLRWARAKARRERSFHATRRMIDRALDSMQAAGKRVVIAATDAEHGQLRLRSARRRARLSRWSNVTFTPLSGSDHDVRPIATQRDVHAVLAQLHASERTAPTAADGSAPAKADLTART